MNTYFAIITSKLHKNKSTGIVEKNLIGEYLPINPIIIEAGAHIGVDTIEMAKKWPKSVIYAFEPVPEIYSCLKKNTSCYKNIICIDKALDVACGEKQMFISSGASDGSSSLLFPKEHLKEHPNVKFKKKIKVETITLESWIKRKNINKVDLLWLDLQGNEPFVLMESKRILKKVRLIYTEVSLKENYSGSILYPEFKNWLREQGFVVLKEELRWRSAGNVLFINSSY